MRQLFDSIRYNLSNLANFKGRASQGQFWPYAICVVLLVFTTSFAAMIPTFTATMERMQKFAIEHPESSTIHSGLGTYEIEIHGNHPELMPDIGQMSLGIGAFAAVVVVLLAATVARRLHDRGRSALWALTPLLFLTFSLVMFPQLTARMADASTSNAETTGQALPMFFAIFFSNLFYLASLVGLLIVLIGRGTRDDNKFGQASAW